MDSVEVRRAVTNTGLSRCQSRVNPCDVVVGERRSEAATLDAVIVVGINA